MISRSIKCVLALLMAVCMVLTLAACAGNKGEQQAETTETAAPSAQATEPENTEPTATEQATEPADTEPAPTEPPAPPALLELPERPKLVQIEPGAYNIKEGDELETQSTLYYLTEAGELYAMGSNQNYQLGVGNNERSPQEVLVMDGVKSITGGCRIFALKEDGSLWTWGIASRWYDRKDPCGFTEPTKILDNVIDYDSAFALTESGELWLTENYSDGTLMPVKMLEGIASFSSDGGTQMRAVTTGGELYGYSCFMEINDDGSVSPKWDGGLSATGVKQACCPGNFFIGTDDSLYGLEYNSSGVVPVELMDNVLNAYTGYGWVYAIKKDGSLWGWCDSDGSGLWFPSRCKGNAVKLLDNVVYVNAEYYMGEDFGVTYAIALTADGELYGWGPNWYGELAGLDAFSMSGEQLDTPAKIAEDVKTVWSDGVNTFIIKNDNSLWGTGYNGAKGSQWEGSVGIGLDPDEGRLGDGTSETHTQDGWHMFVKITDNARLICQRLCLVFTEYEDGTDSTHTFARVFMLDTDGGVWGWGYNKDGAIALRGDPYLLEPKPMMSPNTK